MNPVRMSFSYEQDLDRVRTFLLDSFRETGMLHYVLPTRIENEKYGPCGPDYTRADDEAIKIWHLEGDKSELLAVSHRGSAGNYHIETRPDLKHMEKELFMEIEKLEREIRDQEPFRILMYTVDPDSKRARTLTEMGYEDYGLHEYNYILQKDASIPENPAPEGFTVRGLNGEEDYPKFIDVVGSVYEHCGEYMTIDRMRFMAKAEFYRDDLHLVAVDEHGKFAAFCFYRLDPLTRIAEVEGVGARKEFEGMGLEETLLSEGARRVRRHDPVLVASVEVDVSDILNGWLESAGFARSVTMNMWGKTIS